MSTENDLEHIVLQGEWDRKGKMHPDAWRNARKSEIGVSDRVITMLQTFSLWPLRILEVDR